MKYGPSAALGSAILLALSAGGWADEGFAMTGKLSDHPRMEICLNGQWDWGRGV